MISYLDEKRDNPFATVWSLFFSTQLLIFGAYLRRLHGGVHVPKTLLRNDTKCKGHEAEEPEVFKKLARDAMSKLVIAFSTPPLPEQSVSCGERGALWFAYGWEKKC